MPDKMRIHLVAGARPNFMKVGPLYHALAETDWADPVLVHTGQHFSADMSDVFLRDLGLPTPHFHLQASGTTHAEKTAAVLTAYEALCLRNRPDWVVVVGDINSTIAATLAAKKLNLPVAHLEAGLRSGDRNMPEEINRLLVDAVADLLWTPSEDADTNLLREGVAPERIVRVGNIMIDAYCMLQERISEAGTAARLGLQRLSYAVVTMHRPVNVDHRENLSVIVDQLIKLAESIPVVFPVHPRTRSRLESFDLMHKLSNAGIRLLEPLGYIEFMNLVANCRIVVTDSGGIQEETSYLGVPCLTARESTERPITLSLGSNQLIAISRIEQAAKSVIETVASRMNTTIPLWDGHAAERVVESLFSTAEAKFMNGTQALIGFGEANPEQAPTGSLTHLFDVIQRVGQPCIVCARVPLNHPDVAALLSQPLVEGVILESEDRELLAAFPRRLGFYTKGGGDWQLPAQVVADMVYVGRWTDFGARVAWLAWRAGIRRIHHAVAFQSHHTRGTIWVAVEKSLRSLLYRLWQSPLRRKLADSTGLAFRLEQYLFSKRLRLFEDLPLPVPGAPTVWQKGKIVVVGGMLGPGGAERQLTATLLGLFARGHRDLHFLHHSPMHKPNDFFLPQLIEAGIPFSQVDLFGDSNLASPGIEEALEQRLAPLGDLGTEVAAYAREFLVRRPEIVHVWLDYVNVVAGLAALLVGVPRIVLSCRSLAPVHFGFIQPYMRPIYRLLAKSPCVTFLNNSEAGASDYRRWLGITPLKIQVVRNGFDFSTLPPPQELPHLRSEYRRRLGIPADAPVVGVIMRISEEKRPLLWIEIARQVGLQVTDAHFLIVGDGPLRKQAETMGREVLADRIHFPGHEKNVFLALAAMDLFMLTSRMEGLPNVLIEAQAIGVPPVAIDAGGTRETVKCGKSGWVIPTSKVSVVVKKVAGLLADKSAVAEAAQYGHTFVRAKFSVHEMIDKTLLMYGYEN